MRLLRRWGLSLQLLRVIFVVTKQKPVEDEAKSVEKWGEITRKTELLDAGRSGAILVLDFSVT